MATQLKLLTTDAWQTIPDPTSIHETEEDYTNDDVSIGGDLMLDNVTFATGNRKNYTVKWVWLAKTDYDKIKALNKKVAYFKHQSGALLVGDATNGAAFLFRSNKREFAFGDGYRDVELELVAKTPTA